jgi:hypothetical protein
MPYHHEIVECPDRSVFAPATARKWHAMTTMVEYEGLKVAGRFVIPLRLVRPEQFPGRDMEADSYLVGRSWDGGVLQVQVWKWVKGKGPVAVTHPLSDPSDPGEAVRSRDYPNLFLLVREWREISRKSIPHPVLGPMTVRVNPKMIDTPQGRRFEAEEGLDSISLDEAAPPG